MLCVWDLRQSKGRYWQKPQPVWPWAVWPLELGLRVLMVDLDPQGSLSSYFRLNPDQTSASSLSLFQERKHLSADFIGQLIINTPFKTSVYCLPPWALPLWSAKP